MRIGIDARCIEWTHGGVARILINLLRRWPFLAEHHRFILYFEGYVPKDEFLYHPMFEHRIIRGPSLLTKRRSIWMNIFMPIEMMRDNLDIFYAPVYYGPLFSPCRKTVVGVWDISYTTHPEHYNYRESLEMSFLSKTTCKKSVGIITCSQFDAKQIQKYYGIPAQRICTLQLAADNKFKPAANSKPSENWRNKYRLPERYILSMGVILNRRNVDVIIDAFKCIYNDYPNVGIAIIGRNATSPYIDIEERIRPLVQEERAIYLSRVSEEELINFYRYAWYYICTSTVDGEALMLKEAMKCGTPVITSPFLEDTIEGKGIIIQNPNSVEETAKTFKRILSHPEFRERYAREGFEWVKTLSWDKTAEKALRFLESR